MSAVAKEAGIISTNTLLAEGDLQAPLCGDAHSISTNTLLAEGDLNAMTGYYNHEDISTNTLLAEGD